MRILFTGFTSRTIGGAVLYDYLSNVDVLKHALELAGHTVVQRPVSLEYDAGIEEDFDCAVIGVAAVNGLSSRYKLGAFWAMHRFGRRAAIFPSDGRNVGVWVNSVRTCRKSVPRMLGAMMKERNNVVDHEIGAHYTPLWEKILDELLSAPQIQWPLLVPTFSWGHPGPFGKLYRAVTTAWDPTNLATPFQFKEGWTWGPDGRLACASSLEPRARVWLLPTLQDQDPWVDRQNCKWPVIQVGNKRKGQAYVSETTLLTNDYPRHWGTLAFGYPLADGGWWRMRYIHAALTGCVVCCDPKDQAVIGGPYARHRASLEIATDNELRDLALRQHEHLFGQAWSADRAIETVNTFVKGLVK